MKKLDKGKWAEKEAAHWLEACSQQAHDFAWHRFADSKAARGLIAAQPSDFLVSLATKNGNRTIYLEVKESALERRLPKAKIGQYGMLRKFAWTNAEVLVLVFMSAFNTWVYLTNDDLFSYEDCPASFPLTNLPTFASAKEALEDYFK